MDLNLLIIKELPYGFIIHDNKGYVIDANKIAEKILCATKEQLQNLTPRDPKIISIKDDGTPLDYDDLPVIKVIKSKEKLLSYIFGIKNRESSIRWINSDTLPIFSSSGELEYVYTLFRDITEERMEHNKLKLLSMASYYSPVAIVITDRDGVIESINPRTTEITGYTLDYLLGKTPRIFQSKNSKTDFKEMWETISSGKVWRGEFLNCKKNGDEYIESATITPVFNDNNEISNYVALKEDVSDVISVHKELEKTLVSLEDKVKDRTESLIRAQTLTLESLATLSELRDNETGAHIKRTKLYVKLVLEKISHKLSYSVDELSQMWNSAPLHDIGKVAIPDCILLKQGKLTADEFEIMKKHSSFGYEALIRVSESNEDDSNLKFAKEITLFHHEKWDGSGYPYGLSGEDIPISARVMALADVYDALRSSRPYKDGFSHKVAVDMILDESGKHFDPSLVDIFGKFSDEFNEIFTSSMEDEFLLKNL